jgi:hypothetical protein
MTLDRSRGSLLCYLGDGQLRKSRQWTYKITKRGNLLPFAKDSFGQDLLVIREDDSEHLVSFKALRAVQLTRMSAAIEAERNTLRKSHTEYLYPCTAPKPDTLLLER